MKPATAQLIRGLGLVIQVPCFFGLLWLGRQNAVAGKVGGIGQSQVLMNGFAIGFCLWAFGTASFYWPRRKPEKKPSDDVE